MIITLCGSTRFKEEFELWNKELTKLGYIVLTPGVFSHSGDQVTDDEKKVLDILHRKKIAMADCVGIINKDGYIGESTQQEIIFAQMLHIPIKYFYEKKEKTE